MKALSIRKVLLIVLALGIVVMGSGLAYALTVHELPGTGWSKYDRGFGAWTVTNQSDFQAGVLSNVDVTSSPGDVIIGTSSNWLAGYSYRKSITLNTSQDVYLNSGGTNTTDGAYTVHTFTTNGTFTVGQAGTIEVLVVAGGGGAGRGTTTTTRNAGGGGAGGLIYIAVYSVSAGSYTVTIGAGGAGSTSTSARGSNGADSVFGSLTAKGGGGGGSTVAGYRTGLDGGSGGGAARYDTTYSAGGTGIQISQSGDSGTYGFGNNGAASTSSGAGGGGGAGGVGTVTTGGPGRTYWGVTYAKGGDAQSNNANGVANTGNGGNAAAANSGNSGGSGGSGIVIVRCLTSNFMTDNSQTNYQMPVRVYRTSGSDAPSGGTVSTVGSNTVHTFNVPGTYTFTVPAHTDGTVQVECWGGGGGGFDGTTSGGGKGGGGGGYARSNLTVSAGDYTVVVGSGGAASSNGGASIWQTNIVVGDYGRGGTSATTAGGAGGTNNIGQFTRNGGTGGNGNGTDDCGGGGGGAGGPDGAGSNGANATTSVGGAGGVGDNGSGGVGGTGGNGTSGNPGTANSKGGGGGGGGDNNLGGGVGGAPGGGGGGGEVPTSPATNQGAAGQVIITYATGSLTGDGTEVIDVDIAGKVYVSDKCKADYSDIRFTTSDSITLLDYWIEESDANVATVWVEFNSISSYPGSSLFYMYYGNADAADTSNENNVFDYVDRGSQAASWSIYGTAGQSATDGDPAPSYYANSSSESYLKRDISLVPARIVTFNVKTDGLGNIYFLTNSDGLGQMYRLDTRASPEHSGFNSTTSWTSWLAPGSGFQAVANQWYKLTIVITSATSANLYYSQTTSSSPSGFGTLIGTYTISSNGGYIGLVGDALGPANITFLDNIIVRKYASPQPTWGTWGVEENPSYSMTNSTIASDVFDTEHAGARWDLLGWDRTLPEGTNIVIEVRVSDAPSFGKNDLTPAWQDVSLIPDVYGQYQQWRATLTTNNSSMTPVLNEVRSLFSW
jgi:hypothetical protein